MSPLENNKRCLRHVSIRLLRFTLVNSKVSLHVEYDLCRKTRTIELNEPLVIEGVFFRQGLQAFEEGDFEKASLLFGKLS